MRSILLSLTLAACTTNPTAPEADPDLGMLVFDTATDGDDDGWYAIEDCDDANDQVYPDAPELCDGLDNDCDGTADDGVTPDKTFYADDDTDGFGDPTAPILACAAPAGAVDNAEDCDDVDPEVHPGVIEVCDGVDNDCDGGTDLFAIDASTWYADFDGDGYGSLFETTDACDQPADYVPDDTDCDDGAGDVNPGAVEVCDPFDVDEDCSGTADGPDAVDVATWYADADDDGYGNLAVSTTACSQPAGFVADATDCNDATAAVSPGAPEICNNQDDDCDTDVDEGATDAPTWYADTDGDLYGNVAVTTTACSQPTGYVADATDCADGNATVSPGAPELCNSLDDDCDTDVDEDPVGAPTWYADDDSDAYGDPTVTTTACSAPTGYVADATDCNDGTAAVSPGAPEICNSEDDNCNSDVDESATDASTWYADTDGDLYGNVAVTSSACTQPTGFVADATDCDDGASAVNPGATEVCNSVDDDCVSGVDEGATDVATWYADADADTYGDPSATTTACSAPTGYVAVDGDCNDAASAVNPGAAEVCDANDVDEDCSGAADDAAATNAVTWYLDADADAYGTDESVRACEQPDGYAAVDGDCDDADGAFHPGAVESCTDTIDLNCDGQTAFADADGDTVAACLDCDDANAAVHPGATEVCNGDDDDCDGTTDVGAVDAGAWYADVDADAAGDPADVVDACTQPTGRVANADDCDDGDDRFHPGATETCDDPNDYNCDGTVGFADDDHDGSPACEDCDDADAQAKPGGVEVCDGADNDCNGDIDGDAIDRLEFHPDVDDDDYGDAATSVLECTAPANYVDNATDCDDTDSRFHPGAREVCTDPNDYDCNGTVAYADADADGTAACRDCDDGDADVHPGATEICNRVDDDCNGSVDLGTTNPPQWYVDADADGATDPNRHIAACFAPTGYFPAGDDDCDDADADVYPGATDVPCDQIDQDCDGVDAVDADDCGDDSGVVIGDTDAGDTDVAVDTDPVDSDVDTDTEVDDTGSDQTGGTCGCATGSQGSMLSLLPAFALLAAARRRRGQPVA